VAAALLLLAGPSFPASGRGEDRDEDLKLKLRLRADIQAGFAPLSITFTGRIKDLDPDDERFCHAGTFLMRKMITSDFHILAGEDPACLHGPEDRDISPTFSYTYVVHGEGSYEFFAMVVTRDGQRIVSNGVPVRVLSNPAGE
jgi:hypothetical protein